MKSACATAIGTRRGAESNGALCTGTTAGLEESACTAADTSEGGRVRSNAQHKSQCAGGMAPKLHASCLWCCDDETRTPRGGDPARCMRPQGPPYFPTSVVSPFANTACVS